MGFYRKIVSDLIQSEASILKINKANYEGIRPVLAIVDLETH